MAIASLIIGIVLIVNLLLPLLPLLLPLFPPIEVLPTRLMVHRIWISPLIGIVGLVLGILALRKARRRIAIAAIVLNSLVILVPVVGFIGMAMEL